MASRSHSWFDVEKLLRGERLIRSGRVRLRTSSPPYWWEGTLILTTDRLFFLPSVENPLLGISAFWLHEVNAIDAIARNRFAVATRDANMLFQALGAAGQLPGGLHRWLTAIDAVRAGARPRTAFQDDSPQRAVG